MKMNITYAFVILLTAVLFVPNAYSGETVISEVEYKGISRIDAEELTDIMSIRPGDVLDRDAVAVAVRRAYRKGIFRDIRVRTEPGRDGAALVFVFDEIPLIDDIIVTGNTHFPGGRIKDIIPFSEDGDFRIESAQRAVSAVLDFYHRKGFPGAGAAIHTKASDAPSTVEVYVSITEGEPLVIKRVEVGDEGAERFMRLSAGDILDKDVLAEDMKRLTEYYKSRKYINPEVGPYEFSGGVLVIPVRKGRKLELEFKGNNVFDDDDLEEETPFLDDETVTEESLMETVERMERLYRSKGYYYVQIASGIEESDDRVRVSFIVFEGRRVILRKIELEGVHIARDAVMDLISLEINEPYNKPSVQDAVDALTGFYNALGYLEMSVAEVAEDIDEDGGLVLTFAVEEGPRTHIKEIRITGNENIGGEEIRKAVALETGAPYNLIDIGDARYRVLSLYRRNGYIDAGVDVESEVDGKDALLDFLITENRRSVVGKVILRGNYKTKPKIIKREVSVEEGDPCNSEEFLKIKQRLYKLGIFNEVAIELYDTGIQSNGSLVKDVIVNVREGKPGSVEFGVGYGEYEEFRTSLDISYNNLGGYNREAGLRAEFSSVEERYILNFREPWLFNRPDLSLNVFLMDEETRKVNIDTDEVLYKVDRLSLLTDIEQEITRRLKANINYEYTFIDTKDVVPGVVLTKEDTGTLGIGSVSTSLFYDTRDNPFNPQSGSINGVVLKVASAVFLSETEYIKGTLHSSWFVKLRKKTVLACSVKAGTAYAFEGSGEIPLIERFFLGGRTTVRGYSHDTLGPKGANNNPTGGNAFALVNVEFRFDVGKGFGLVTFVDAGNVWRLVEDIGTELKYTAGAGLRYNTPVGPVRLDYGRKLREEEGLSSGEVHFSFGHAF